MKMIDHIDRVKKAVEYIESHLLEDFTLKEVAKEACYSLYHLHRIFHSLTGFSLKEYIRQRRLSLAAHDIISTDQAITDIAFQYQYSTLESFSRAFKRQFFYSPQHVKREQMIIAHFEKSCFDQERSQLLKGFSSTIPDIISQPSFTIIGKVITATLNDNEHIEQELKLTEKFNQLKLWDKIPNQKINNKGITIGTDIDKTTKHFSLFMGCPVKEISHQPEGFLSCTIKASKYACFKITATRPIVQIAWDTIFNDWILQSPYEFDQDGLCFEIYPQYWDGFTPETVEIHIALK